MPDGEATVRCGECGLVIDQSPSLPIEEREPCPCGSLARQVAVHVQDAGVTMHDSIALKARHDGQKEPFHEGKYGDDLFRKTGKWNRREMTIDRDTNRYRELITDPDTGRVIRDVDEPLDQHRGRGSAKKK